MFAPTRPKIRDLCAADAGALADLHLTGFDHGWSEAEFERFLTDIHCVGQAAVDAHTDRLLAAILSRRVLDEDEVLTIVTHPTRRRCGFGRDLLRHHLDVLARVGVSNVFLEVAEDNAAALRLYAGEGFLEVGRRAAYYARPGEAATAFVMRRRLE